MKSYRKEREFGLIVGGITLLLAAWWLYRGKFPAIRPAMLVIGGLLLAFGALWPRALVWPNKAWMLLAEALSFVTTRIILAIVFFFVVTPIGVIKRMFGWDPLNRRSAGGGSYWRPYPARQHDHRHYEKMY
jgi:hypothetical protein